MRAILKRLYSPDVDIDKYAPENERFFGFLMQAMIGPDDSGGEESFDFLVCTPEWLEARHASEPCVFGRGVILVFSYDLSFIRKMVERLCSSASSDNWNGIAAKIDRYADWEFSSYQADSGG